MNIIEIIINEIQSDSCDTEKEADYLKNYYEQATKPQREAINRTLIALCGWSFETLLEMERKEA